MHNNYYALASLDENLFMSKISGPKLVTLLHEEAEESVKICLM